jgi:hypothetical protein
MMAAPEYLHLGPTWSAVLFWGGIIVFLITIVVVGALSIHEQRKRRAVFWPVLLMSFGAVVFGVGAAWYLWPSKTEATAETSPLDGEIQIASDPYQYPTVVPQNKMFELQLHNQFSATGGAFLGTGLPAGSPLPPRDPSIYPLYGIRLRISNYGKIAIVNATIAFPIEFLEVIRGSNGFGSGEVIKSTTISMMPFSIGPGEIIDIYAMNHSTDAFARVLVPQTAQGYMPGSDKRETFKLVPPVFLGMAIKPFAPKSPPVESSAVSMPPSRPKGK